ncbi:hypothetical protein [Flammeovirga sp. SJP92]|uniref:hypothetical protein n=1 Tax=Flammeovirga sp. SJP92 TaxID=1775430 RepID=UPI000787DDA9|nr:hypothetical protein [Flammeovirga sp. SJP92]KXX68592.1 hypothetical protein AVL50_22800 [Flammeovirga sp. SJP92]
MTLKRYRSLITAGVFALLMACKPEVEDFTPSGGSSNGTPIDYTTYVALGNSLTAGVSDGAWLASSQVNSYPQLIANSLQQAGLGAKDFAQPLITHSGNEYFGQPLILTNAGPCFTCTEAVVPTSNIYADHGGFHNMAVSGMKAIEVNNPALALGLYGYFASQPGASTVLTDALALDPTFYTMWLGANDVLGYAQSGGSLGSEAITPQEDYEAAISSVLDAMDDKGAKGALLNIPDITEAALFNFIPSDLEGVLQLAGQELSEPVLGLVNGFMDNAIGGVKNPTITDLVTPSIDIGNGTMINVVAGVVAQIQGSVGDPTYIPKAVEIATAIVYAGAYAEAIEGGASEEMAQAIANAYVASAEGQAAISLLVGIGIDASWASASVEEAISSSDEYMKANGSYPVFTMESNQMPVYDATSPTQMRQTTVGTKFTLLAQGKVSALVNVITGGGSLPDDLQEVLPVPTAGEALLADDVKKVQEAVEGYNAFLKEQADARDLAYVDTKSIMSEAAQTGIIIDGVTYTTAYLSGNLFSLDGAHLTQRGYAVIGNLTIQAINAKYNAKIPQIQQNDFPVVETTPTTPAPAGSN